MKGMTNVTGELDIKDRWNLKIIKVESHEVKSYTPIGMAYVMMRNASFESKDISLSYKYGCVNTRDPFTIECEEDSSACIVDFPGLSLLETRIFIQECLDMGNLSYMDGGTNTTAINPGRLGDPVINYVHFPAHMYQTLHTHPSHRVGLVIRGNGKIELDNKEYYDINEGEIFFMRRNCLHNFICEDEDVVVFVWSPDSGTGPTDEVNPLKIRTYVGQQRYHK